MGRRYEVVVLGKKVLGKLLGLEVGFEGSFVILGSLFFKVLRKFL